MSQKKLGFGASGDGTLDLLASQEKELSLDWEESAYSASVTVGVRIILIEEKQLCLTRQE